MSATWADFSQSSCLALITLIRSSCALRNGRVEQLLFPQERNATATGMLHDHVRYLCGSVHPSPIALPFRRNRQPRHHVRAGLDHAVDGDLMRFDRCAARCVCYDRYIPAFAKGLDRRHGDANFSPESGDDQLFAAGRLNRIHCSLIFPRVDERPVDYLLAWEYLCDLGEQVTTPLGDDSGQEVLSR